MSSIDRGVVTWTGSGVTGGGVTVMYATPGGTFMTHIRTFFEAIKSNIPNTITLTYPSSGDTIDDATGNLVGSWSGATLTPTVGGSSNVFASPVGAVVNWNTSTIIPAHGGKPPRVLRGRTFVSPLGALAYDGSGTLDNAYFATLQTAANALVTAGASHFCIWHRPTSAGATDGALGNVLSARVRDKVAVLTSRRD